MKANFYTAKKKRFCLILFISVTIVGIFKADKVSAQSYFQGFEKKLTPSPMVAALGNYGGLDIKKSTGGIQKSISLFEVKDGDLTYSPSIEYFSTGIKVDDWGSHVGMGWTENITAVISRTVRGVPDEKATSRTGDTADEFGDPYTPDYNSTNYDKVRAMSQSGTTLDGEYDLFNFNIFGNSGEFFIRNGQAILLKNNNSVKIEVTQTSPTYKFIITDTKGVRYYFEDATETTYFNSDNDCDADNPYHYGPITTGWFINKMVSPGNNTINFNYNYAEYSYIYDYHESYLYYDILQLHYTDVLWSGEANSICEGAPASGSRTVCLRKKTTRTQRLTSVTGDNFAMYFDYESRNDIYDEKLLSNISFQNNAGFLSNVAFEYDQVVATSSFETVLTANLSGDPWENNALKTRYYLKNLKFGDDNSNIKQSYKFTYLNPEILPHHFSLSQDYLGYYNAKTNSSLIPRISIEDLTFNPFTGPPTIAYGNRDPELIGKAGLLSSITYPTGGKDTVDYEQNIFRTLVENQHKTTWEDWFENTSTSTYSGALFDMHVTRSGPANIKIECYYNSDDPKQYPEEEYSADAELWGNEGHISWPGGTSVKEFHLGSVYNSTTGLFPHQQVLNLIGGNDYTLHVNINGPHTTLKITLTYIDSVYNVPTDSIYPGYRVKKVISQSINSPDLVKSYNYNVFSKINDQLAFTDSSSLITASIKDYRYVSFSLCDAGFTPGPGNSTVYVPYVYMTFTPRGNYDLNKYAGMPYVYKNVTEFNNIANSSFNASEFGTSANDYGARIMVDYYPFIDAISPGIENIAWDTGLELKRYTGAKIGSAYKIDRENQWVYSDINSTYYNYSASQLHREINISTDQEQNFQPFIVTRTTMYTHWTTLDTLKQIDYFRNGSGYRTVMNKTLYRYNATDKQLEEEETTNSKGETLLKQTWHPNKMVSLGINPTIYQGMVDQHQIAPEIVVTNKKSGVQTSMVKTNYFQPYTGLFVPDSIQTQQGIGDPLVTRLKYLRYDTRGNVLSLSQDGGPVLNILWSYKGKYPVAKIFNADYTTIENTLGATNIASFADNYPIKSDVDTFIAPLKTAFPNAQFSTFTYFPHIGMQSQTDVKGNSTYYKYDSFQQLENIFDQHGNVVKSYLYNFKQH